MYLIFGLCSLDLLCTPLIYIGKKETQVLHDLQKLPNFMHVHVDGKWKVSNMFSFKWTWFKGRSVYFTPDSIFCAPDSMGRVYCQYYFAQRDKSVEQIVGNKRLFIPIHSVQLDQNNLVIKGTTIDKKNHLLTLKDVRKLPEFEKITKWLELDQSPTSNR